MLNNHCNLALDIGGTSVKIGLVKDKCIVASFVVNVNSNGSSKEIIHQFEEIGNRCMELAFEFRLIIKSVGVSIPGPFDYNAGVFLMDHKYRAVKGISLNNSIFKAVGKVPIAYMSDAAAFLIGALSGKHIYDRNICGVTLGTGLGIAGWVDGRIQKDENGGPVIKLYTTPYKESIAEEYVSKHAIMQRYFKKTGKTITVAQMDSNAHNGDKDAIDVFEETGYDLAEIMNPILKEYNFEMMVLGGQISKAGDLLLIPIRKKLGEMNAQCNVAIPDNLSEAALLGAVSCFNNV